MFAVRYSSFGSPDVLELGEMPEPHAGPGEVRVVVRASGVAPVDLGIRAGTSPSSSRLTLPHIPGVDAAGVIDEIGEGVDGCRVGDEVFGMVSLSRLGGASAQYAVLDFWQPRPASLAWEQAGAAASSVETATRALDSLGELEGRTLLIDGASGGVGSIAVQLAAARGARVVGTASAANQGFVAELGATPVLYGDGLPERLRDIHIDSALDVAGAGPLEELIAITGGAASVVSIANYGAASLGVHLSIGELAGQPSGRHGLAIAAGLSERGLFRVPVHEVFPFARAAEAHAAAARSHPGKIVLTA